MGRHDIKLRRQRMTSGRIEGYKDYNSLMQRHKSDRIKRLIKLLFLLLFFISMSLFTYYLLDSKKENTGSIPVKKEINSTRPGV